MKRFLAAAIMAAYSACFPLASETGGGRVELSCWTPFLESDGAIFNSMVEQYNASQDRIRVKNLNTVFNTYYSALTDAVAARTLPDIIVLHQERIADYAKSGTLLRLDEYAPKAGVELSTFEPNLLDDCRTEGSIYALPLDAHPLVLFYNTDLFAKAGIDTPPSTLAELIDAGKAIQAKTGAIGISMETASGAYMAHTITRLFMSLLKQQGKSVLNADNTKADVDNPAGVAAYRTISDLIYKNELIPWGLTYDFALENFRTGNAGMHINGVWAAPEFDARKGLHFGVAQLPPLLGGNASWSGSHVMAVAATIDRSSERRLLAALNFIDWMTSHAETWARNGYVPARKTVYSKRSFMDMPHTSDYAGAARNSFAPPNAAAWTRTYLETTIFLEDAIANRKDAKAAMAALQERLDEILSK